MAAIRFDPELKAWYERLCARGKSAPCALWAVAHKMLRRLTGRIRDLRKEQHALILPLAA